MDECDICPFTQIEADVTTCHLPYELYKYAIAIRIAIIIHNAVINDSLERPVGLWHIMSISIEVEGFATPNKSISLDLNSMLSGIN